MFKIRFRCYSYYTPRHLGLKEVVLKSASRTRAAVVAAGATPLCYAPPSNQIMQLLGRKVH